MVTVVRLPLLCSPVMTCEAEHRDDEEHGQENVRGNDANHRAHVYQVAGATFCEETF